MKPDTWHKAFNAYFKRLNSDDIYKDKWEDLGPRDAFRDGWLAGFRTGRGTRTKHQARIRAIKAKLKNGRLVGEEGWRAECQCGWRGRVTTQRRAEKIASDHAGMP